MQRRYALLSVELNTNEIELVIIPCDGIGHVTSGLIAVLYQSVLDEKAERVQVRSCLWAEKITELPAIQADKITHNGAIEFPLIRAGLTNGQIGDVVWHDGKEAHSAKAITDIARRTNFNFCERCRNWFEAVPYHPLPGQRREGVR